MCEIIAVIKNDIFVWQLLRDEWKKEVIIWDSSYTVEMECCKYSQQDLELQLHPEDPLNLVDPTAKDKQDNFRDWLWRS